MSSNALHLAVCRQFINVTTAFILGLLFIVCDVRGRMPVSESVHAQPGKKQQPRIESDSAFEATQTQKHLGVAVQDFPLPQGLTGYDELTANAPVFRFNVIERSLSGAEPRASYDIRQSVRARAPDGSNYEAYLGRGDSKDIAPDHGFVSTLDNTRQRYGTHHGYGYHPQDVFIGKREAGRLKPTLFFRDVGSHTTAPHHLSIDSQGRVHLVIADVNIFQDNRLDLYWMVGNPVSGKWTAAWLIDRRGFTSSSHPWSTTWGGKVNLVWNWNGMNSEKGVAGSGAFHVEWSPAGFGRKVRIISGDVNEWDAAIDQQSGRLLLVYSKDDGVYVLSRPEGGRWSRATRLHPRLNKRHEVTVEASDGGAFIVRTGSGGPLMGSEGAREWVLRVR